METLKNYKVLGFTTDFTICDCCGKSDLTKTVAIIDLTHEVVLHFGSSCAAKADKYDTLEAATKAKKEIQKEGRKFDSLLQSANQLTYNTLRKIYGVIELAPYSYKVNCSDAIINECNAQAIKHLQQGYGRIFNYTI